MSSVHGGIGGAGALGMELRELAAFVAVAEEGGMSAASRRLHISQPALSQTVNTLERELGVQLLVRSNTGVHTTEAGSALLSEARARLRPAEWCTSRT